MTSFAFAIKPPTQQQPTVQIEVNSGLVECILNDEVYCVRRAIGAIKTAEAMSLVKSMYTRRTLSAYFPVSPVNKSRQITIEACSAGKVVGTLTLGFDCSKGLLADALYSTEINAFRTQSRRMVEVRKLAVDPQYGSKQLFAYLFQLAYIYGHLIHGATDGFIEVHPRHAVFYKRTLGFRRLGEMKTCERVNAPAVLMHICLYTMRRQIAEHAGVQNSRMRSLYPYFIAFPAEELIGRILQHK
jgi:hypothetical protein